MFYIDLSRPEITAVAPLGSLLPGRAHEFKALVVDDGQITGCAFFLPKQGIQKSVHFSSLPCRYGVECELSATHFFEADGSFEGLFACSDAAGNIGKSVTLRYEVRAVEKPVIKGCDATLVIGKPGQEFAFTIDMENFIEDSTSFLWDFGDGVFDAGRSVVHGYTISGIYFPSVVVKNIQGGESSCKSQPVFVQDE